MLLFVTLVLGIEKHIGFVAADRYIDNRLDKWIGRNIDTSS